ncbi:unnamed protein product [Symbiodinium pilosum]|uniref:Uncharacterized protein n=1 Tax=Symbiodinium pilosum TaxID=2952 RepID=A0A812NY97_SYMPI|nr:unnamed protein product [Symbiodinium pilosum]
MLDAFGDFEDAIALPEIRRMQLMRASCGGTFVGRFAPRKDPRLRAVKAASKMVVDSVVFSFSNASSWFTHNEVELVTLLEELPCQDLQGVHVAPSSPQTIRKKTEDYGAYPSPLSALTDVTSGEGDDSKWHYDWSGVSGDVAHDSSPTPSTEEEEVDEETARRARALAKAQRYGHAV